MLGRAARGTGRLLLQSSRRPGPRAWPAPAPERCSSSLPMNTVVLFVPQQEAWVVERMGRFHRILEPGLNFLIPLLDRIRYVQSLKEIVINVPEQSAVTLDNVTLQIDGVLYLRIMDPYKASYGVEDPEYAVTQLAQTTMRSELGKISLDKVFRERESLNACIVDAINQASDCWGIRCLRYEIKDIHVPPRVKDSMQMQVEAERRKRATVLESEGTRESAINVAEGQKQAQILASEAEKAEQINKAAGEANAMLAKAKAKAEAIRLLADALTQQVSARCWGGRGSACVLAPGPCSPLGLGDSPLRRPFLLIPQPSGREAFPACTGLSALPTSERHSSPQGPACGAPPLEPLSVPWSQTSGHGEDGAWGPQGRSAARGVTTGLGSSARRLHERRAALCWPQHCHTGPRRGLQLPAPLQHTRDPCCSLSPP
ncbi:hypothetical protein KIL84_013150 [Mauremys mutica]|uniref:Stomatin-like protein 2, mitochondrial n=1 Tax=Mauremys mutica TaxID=74926 RepID=A0A9D3WX42_9SAUR|nr:hypothetical protein KIL84_013150 [Mauremys mutica]